MLIYYFVHLPLRFPDAEGRLLSELGSLDEWAGDAYRATEQMSGEVGPSDRVAKAVRMTVGKPLREDGTMTIPVAWEATGTPWLFPRMDADLVLSRVGSEHAHLAFRGSYQPPLGVVGRTLDRLVLHRLAEATVKHFVDRLSVSLGASAERAAEAASP